MSGLALATIIRSIGPRAGSEALCCEQNTERMATWITRFLSSEVITLSRRLGSSLE